MAPPPPLPLPGHTFPMTEAGTPALTYISAMAAASPALTSSTRPSSSANREAKAPCGSWAGAGRLAVRPQLPAEGSAGRVQSGAGRDLAQLNAQASHGVCG